MGNVSLDSDEWKNKAMLVAGLKMLESLNKVGCLKSFIATRQLNNVDIQRENRSENAKIIYRAINYAIENGTDVTEAIRDAGDDIVDNVNWQSQELINQYNNIDMFKQTKEYDIFTEYRENIRMALEDTFNQSSPHNLF